MIPKAEVVFFFSPREGRYVLFVPVSLDGRSFQLEVALCPVGFWLRDGQVQEETGDLEDSEAVAHIDF